jgi:uncharacterized Zn finger protein
MSWWSYKPYVSVARRRANAAREIRKLEKEGQKVLPVRLEGQTIARTFWGKAWCNNLDSYSDYDNRLPRGRSYVRNGSVCDLQIEPGRVTALVWGSELYRIKIAIKPLAPRIWKQIKQECGGQIGSVIELLQGKLSSNVMEVITRPGSGLFPKPAEIDLDCSCPDWADLCKHVAAALYGVGARLDEKPELLFVLRQVDHLELIQQAADIGRLTGRATPRKTIAADALSDVFGMDFNVPPAQESRKRRPPSKRTPPSTAADSKEPSRGSSAASSAPSKRSNPQKVTCRVSPSPVATPSNGKKSVRRTARATTERR